MFRRISEQQDRPTHTLVHQRNRSTRVSQMKTLNTFFLVIYSTQKVHNDFIFVCSIVLPPLGHSSNHEYHCWNLQDNQAVVRIFIALLRFSVDSPSYLLYAALHELCCNNKIELIIQTCNKKKMWRNLFLNLFSTPVKFRNRVIVSFCYWPFPALHLIILD